jgi:hypothetical protein
LVYVTAAGLVTLAVERYGYAPAYLVGMAGAGIALILVAVLKQDE